MSGLPNDSMRTRLNYTKAAPGVYDAMDALDQYLAGSSLDKRLLYLVQLRASQLNGCAYCVESVVDRGAPNAGYLSAAALAP